MATKILALAFIGYSLLFFSCESSADQKNISSEIFDSTSATTDTTSLFNEDDLPVSYNLPSALQIAYVFKKSGATFFPELLNNKTNVAKYNSGNYKRAVNFGIYSADLAYCIFNKKYQESKEYLKACKDVGSYLGLNQAFESNNMAHRFDKNITNEDSIIKIISSVQLKTDVMFEQNKQKHITVIAFTGAWVESLHIALGVYNNDKSKNVLANLLEQLLLSHTILKALKANNESEKEMPNLILDIEKIHTSFNSISDVKTAIEKDEEMDFTFMKVSESELKLISESVKYVRTTMTE